MEALSVLETNNEERIEEISSALAIQLHALHPIDKDEDNDHDNVIVDDDLMKSCFYTMMGNNIEIVDDIKKAIPQAVKQWKHLQSETRKKGKPSSVPKSFSLLDQFMTGGFDIVNIRQIQEETSITTRLSMLEKIQYLDDVLPEWESVRSMMLMGLKIGQTIATRKRYLQLHRTFYHLGRTSNDFLGIQNHILQNISTCICEHIEGDIIPTPEKQQEEQWICDLIHNFNDIFIDLIQRDQYCKEEMQQIENTYAKILISADKTLELELKSPSDILAQIDPYGFWFALWTRTVSRQDVITFWNQHGDLLSLTFHRCEQQKNTNSLEQSSLSKNSTNPLQSLSLMILSHTLNCTRAMFFPWTLLEASLGSIIDDNTYSIRLKTVLMYLSNLAHFAAEEEHLSRLCLDAVETILRGSPTKDLTQFKEKIAVFQEANTLTLKVGALLEEVLPNEGI